MRYKTIMLGRASYAKLASAKRNLRKKSGQKLSFEDLISDIIDRKLDLAPMDDRLKKFIEKVAFTLSEINGVDGVLLFGSVAKGTYNQNSDIDIAVFTRSNKLETLHGITTLKGDLSKDSIALLKLGLPHAISPIVLDNSDIKTFKPFYFDLADYGMILYEKGKTVSDFVDSMKWKDHRREVIRGAEVITW